MSTYVHAIAKRYAVALFEIAKEKNSITQFQYDLEILKDVFDSEKETITLLSNPRVEKKMRKKIVAEACKDLSPYILNTVYLLIDRHREAIIPHLCDEFMELSNAANGVKEARVYTVRPLNEDEKNALSNVFAAKVNARELKIENIIDDSILGGIKIRIGNTIFDGTLSGKLERIRRQLTANRT